MRRDGTVEFVRRDTDWHDVRDEDEAFYLRIAAAAATATRAPTSGSS